ncbi:A24 family peptidase [Syntrophorhabdus aromaticivorans]|uniref:A24 family peptidase n=1 Tax=Syntrophorhabdus aromaticivorans TaxID=328301 RepID=UPI000407E58A|nr:A24 family peptidase [Syntrophorhabdus aromaticivorans]
MIPQVALILIVLIISIIFDVKFRRIPNWLTFPAIGAGIVFNTLAGGVQGLLAGIAGMIVGFLLFILFYMLGGMGAGDVKLAAAIGAFLGPRDILWSALLTAIAGGCYAVIVLIAKGYTKDVARRYFFMIKMFLVTRNLTYIPGEGIAKAPRLAYAIPIAVGTSLVLAKKFM